MCTYVWGQIKRGKGRTCQASLQKKNSPAKEWKYKKSPSKTQGALRRRDHAPLLLGTTYVKISTTITSYFLGGRAIR